MRKLILLLVVLSLLIVGCTPAVQGEVVGKNSNEVIIGPLKLGIYTLVVDVGSQLVEVRVSKYTYDTTMVGDFVDLR